MPDPLPPRVKDLWRISNHRSLTGEGGLRYAARWHSAGRRIVYLAESPAGAMLEVLVHLELAEDELPPAYSLLRVAIPEDVTVTEISVPAGGAWKTNLESSRGLGNDWLIERATAMARVPSAILADTFNYLLNPLHPDAERIYIVSESPAEFDSRLFKRMRG